MIIIYVLFTIVAMLVAILLKPANGVRDLFKGNAVSEDVSFKRTIEQYSQAIESEMGAAMAEFFRGSAYLMVGQNRKAYGGFVRAKKMGKRIPQSTLDLCN